MRFSPSGDAEFQKKCLGKMKDVSSDGRTVLFVSHNMAAIRSLCSRAILLSAGAVLRNSDIDSTCERYLDIGISLKRWRSIGDGFARSGSGELRCVAIRMRSIDGHLINAAPSGDAFEIEIDYFAKSPVRGVRASIDIDSIEGYRVTTLYSGFVNEEFDVLPGAGRLICRVTSLPLLPDKYRLNVMLGHEYGHMRFQCANAITIQLNEVDLYGTGRDRLSSVHTGAIVSRIFLENGMTTQVSPQTCVVCDLELSTRLSAPERMFGLGGQFVFGKCPNCGMLSQIDPPQDMSPYYPLEKYYSFSNGKTFAWQNNLIKQWFAYRRNEAQLFGHPVWARPIASRKPLRGAQWIETFVKYTDRKRGLRLRVLDIGCGGGDLLCSFASLGFTSLNGVDPYITTDEIRIGPIRIRRQSHSEIKGERFDLVILNHSLEHMNDQIAAMKSLAPLLSADGIARIEVPVADCDAFDIYHGEWIELDPPRHLHLHTRKSLKLLAEQTNLEVIELEESGGAFEFWGSELYRRGLTFFNGHASRLAERRRVIFSPKNMVASRNWLPLPRLGTRAEGSLFTCVGNDSGKSERHYSDPQTPRVRGGDTGVSVRADIHRL